MQNAATTTGHVTPGNRKKQMSKWGLRTDMDDSSGVAKSEIRVCDKIIDDIITLGKKPYEMSVVPGHFRGRDTKLEAMSHSD